MNNSFPRVNEDVAAILKQTKAEPAFAGTIKEGCECKYTIINLKDLEKYIGIGAKQDLAVILDHVQGNIEHGREEDGKKPFNNYIVINIDEPYINDIVAVLETNGHWDGQKPNVKNIVDDVREASELHLQTILELQRIQSMVHPIDDPVNRSIGVALNELEVKFQKIHDKWSE
ncbi:hypothetical protein [Lysinibacillus boronitolerans]|uniref:hypothetical protein n=1 Tax=Lysinibacillus boronitolerans TaxID=309788 RepID=UPI001595BB8D|nr:hypothetical protein [Lysinibacillus boronitolerans]